MFFADAYTIFFNIPAVWHFIPVYNMMCVLRGFIAKDAHMIVPIKDIISEIQPYLFFLFHLSKNKDIKKVGN